MVAGQATGVLAAPASAPSVSVAINETLQPVLKAAATTGGSGAQSVKFFARTPGASTWDLLNGTTVTGTSGTARIPAGKLSVQSAFEYRAEHCDSSGCITSPVKTGRVSSDLGIGPRAGASRVPFAIGDAINAQVDAGSGNLMVSTPQFTLPRVAGDLSVGAVYNSISRLDTEGNFTTSLSSGWRLSTGSDVNLWRDPTTGAVVYSGPNGLTGSFWPVTGSADKYVAPAGFKMDLVGTTAAGWTLTDHASFEKQVFNPAGQLTVMRDRNGNETKFAYNGQSLTSITGDSGPTAAPSPWRPRPDPSGSPASRRTPPAGPGCRPGRRPTGTTPPGS